MRGKAKFGVSVIYKGRSELRFTNLTEPEARETIKTLREPDDITTSKPNPNSQATDTLEDAKQLANKLRSELGFNLLTFEKRPRGPPTEYDAQIKTIRNALKKLCSTLSVRRGTGTAYSWIEVSGSLEFGEFTQEEKAALEKFGLNYGLNFSVISPENRDHYVEKAKVFLQHP